MKFSSGTIWFDAEALGLIIQFFTSFKPDEIDTTHAHVDSRTTQTMESEVDHNDVLISEEIEKVFFNQPYARFIYHFFSYIWNPHLFPISRQWRKLLKVTGSFLMEMTPKKIFLMLFPMYR